MSSPDSISPYRYYQREALDAFWKTIGDGNILISLATGTGKSRVAAGICKEAIETYQDTNIVIAISSGELVKQNFEEMLEIWPNAPAGIYSAGVGQKNLNEKITVGTIQSLWRKAFSFRHKIDLVIADECQDISEENGTMYRKFIADLKVANPDIKVVGLSATIFRLSQGLLTDGKNALFDKVVYEYGMLQGIKDGYLSPLTSKYMNQHFDLTGVGISKGDYKVGQLERAVDIDSINKAVVNEMMAYGHDRKCWLAFCVSIEHAIHIRDEVRSRGIACEAVSSKTPKAERADIFKRYKAGEIRCLTNVNILSKGSNIPQIDLISAIRPSKSAGFVVQACGRGTRLSPGKENCLLLDHAGWLLEHGPIDLIKPKRKGEKGDGVAPTKTCPECKTIVFAGCSTCPECDFEFLLPEPEIDREASTAAALSIHLKVETHPVTHISYYRHQKEGKPDSLRVEYMCGLKHNFRDWWCFDHGNSPRNKACMQWHKHAGTKAPNTTTEALERVSELKTPKEVHVKKAGKYFEIVGTKL